MPRVTSRPRAAAAAMGRSRGGAGKASTVFSIARSGVLRAKGKGKARPVTSGLKQVSAGPGEALAGRASARSGLLPFGLAERRRKRSELMKSSCFRGGARPGTERQKCRIFTRKLGLYVNVIICSKRSTRGSFG